RRRRGASPAREAARCVVQHGGAQGRAVDGHRAGRRCLRPQPDPVWPARLGNPQRRPRRWTARRGGGVRRPRLRARRIAGFATQARLRDPRRRCRRGARRAHGQGAHGRRHRRLGGATRGRHHLRARRHTRIGRAGREDPRRARGGRRHGESDWCVMTPSAQRTAAAKVVRPESPITDPDTSLFGWWPDAGRDARHAFIAASLGWMLDSFDVMLYAIVLAALIQDPTLHLSFGVAGILGSVTLVAAAVGGIAFGVIADRVGRKRALIAAVLIYSVFTAACGFAQTAVQLAVFRILLGIGMGGEGATGVALVSETFPARHRGKALPFLPTP